MRGSLRACPEALRLDDVVTTNGLVLFSLDVADYPHATRKVASWILLGMGRLARQLGALIERPADCLASHACAAPGGRGGRAWLGGTSPYVASSAVARERSGSRARDARARAISRRSIARCYHKSCRTPRGSWCSGRAAHMMRVRLRRCSAKRGRRDVMRLVRRGRSSSRKVERPRVSVDEWMNAIAAR
jgi:hypothetical protein